MAVKRRPTTYQYEPLVTPSKWQGDELRFSVRLTQILDDLYQKFSSLRTGSGSASVAIADDANKLGGVEASKYALKTGTVANANKLGGKAPEYYLSPRNLLDNSDFRNPVNQRGGTSHTASENTASYWLDRWQFGRGTAALVDGGLSIVWNGNTSYGPNAYFRQTLGTALDVGKTYTLAVKVDGQIEAYSFINPSDDAADLYFKTNVYRVQIDSNKRTFVFYNYTTTPKVFEWAALYEGEYTAETLPPYVPKPYVVELEQCRRYYRALYRLSFAPYNVSPTTRYYRIPIEPPMRDGVVPTVTVIGPLERPLNSWTDTAAEVSVTLATVHEFTLQAVSNITASDCSIMVDEITISSDL